MSAAVLQSASYEGGGFTAPTFSSTPTVGNLVILVIYPRSGNGYNTANLNGWTYLAGQGGSYGIAIYYRFVQMGDGTTYGWQGTTGGGGTQSSAQDYAVTWEISGAPSTWGAAYDTSNFDSPTLGTSTSTSTNLTSANANELSLIAAFEGISTVGFPAAPTFTAGGYTTDQSPHGQILGSGASGDLALGAAGSSTQYTVTWWPSAPTTDAHMMTLLINSAASPIAITPNAGSAAFTGYAPALVIAEAPTTGVLTLTGFAPTIKANLSDIPAAGSLALTGFAPGVSLVAHARPVVFIAT